MLDISRLSSSYEVRRMSDANVDVIFELCRKNREYYRWCGKENSKELIISDLHITPPGIDICDKYYVGFYDKEELMAVMDLIDGYPEKDTAFIGFFMMDHDHQGNGVGTVIIDEVSSYLKDIGIREIQLGIDKDNPQSNHFWKKNGFEVIREIKREDGTILYAGKSLR